MTYINFYHDYKDKIFSYFFYNLDKNYSLAEDFTSDTFLKAFKSFDSYNAEYKFSTWIFTIARNILYDYYRKEKVNISLDEETEITFEEFLKYEENLDEKIDIDIKMQEVYKHIEKIPIFQKEVIVMKYMGDISIKDISNMTGKSPGNIRKALSRGLKTLSSSLSLSK